MLRYSDQMLHIELVAALILCLVTPLVVAAQHIPAGSILLPSWLSSESLPAWVQAGGSVAAILVAIYVADRQAKHARLLDARRQSRETAALVSSLIAMSEEAYFLLRERVKVRHRPELAREIGYAFRDLRAKSAISALERIDVNRLPSELLPSFVSFLGALSAISENMDRDKDLSENSWSIIWKVLAVALGSFRELFVLAQQTPGLLPADISLQRFGRQDELEDVSRSKFEVTP